MKDDFNKDFISRKNEIESNINKLKKKEINLLCDRDYNLYFTIYLSMMVHIIISFIFIPLSKNLEVINLVSNIPREVFTYLFIGTSLIGGTTIKKIIEHIVLDNTYKEKIPYSVYLEKNIRRDIELEKSSVNYDIINMSIDKIKEEERQVSSLSNNYNIEKKTNSIDITKQTNKVKEEYNKLDYLVQDYNLCGVLLNNSINIQDIMFIPVMVLICTGLPSIMAGDLSLPYSSDISLFLSLILMPISTAIGSVIYKSSKLNNIKKAINNIDRNLLDKYGNLKKEELYNVRSNILKEIVESIISLSNMEKELEQAKINNTNSDTKDKSLNRGISPRKEISRDDTKGKRRILEK